MGTARQLGIVVVVALVSAAVGGAGVYLAIVPARDGGHPGHEHEAPPASAERWTCPMHPTIVRDRPGECPICGMALVPLAAPSTPSHASGASGLSTVEIDPARQQLIGLRTATVAAGLVGGSWRTVGRVAVDETRVRHINLKIGGFVERLHVDFLGKPVKKGDPLFEIYSPELYSAQEELLLALRTQDALAGSRVANGEDLVRAARRRLELWDVPEPEIERLMRTREATKTLVLRSPISGVLTKKDVVQGMRLEAGAMPLEITDLSEVWVLADVYESDIRNVQVGMRAELTLKAFPDRTFRGKVVFLDPLLDPKTRTIKVRLTFPNPTGELRPEMFGEVDLLGKPRQALRIAADAVIPAGTRSVVFVDLGVGKLQPREVKLGERGAEFVEVVEGLAAGEHVVTRANFLVDSESRLRASLDAMGRAP